MVRRVSAASCRNPARSNVVTSGRSAVGLVASAEEGVGLRCPAASASRSCELSHIVQSLTGGLGVGFINSQRHVFPTSLANITDCFLQSCLHTGRYQRAKDLVPPAKIGISAHAELAAGNPYHIGWAHPGSATLK